MSVPTIVDPRDPMTLSCTFDMGGEELNSVKWYKDEEEFFRYMPLQHPSILTFPVAGVHLVDNISTATTAITDTMSSSTSSTSGGMGGIRASSSSTNNRTSSSTLTSMSTSMLSTTSCTTSKCTIVLQNLTRSDSSGIYKCEISTEAPTFKVVFSTVNVTVVALPRENPRIEGLASFYSIGELIAGNCTIGPADPPPILTWHLNNKPLISRALVGPTVISHPDEQGLKNTTLALHLIAEKRNFIGPNSAMKVECIATSQAVPQPPLRSSVTIALKDSNAQHLNNQKLEWPNNSNTVTSMNIAKLFVFNLCVYMTSLTLHCC